ncbi:MAG: hypothetical protein K2R98_32810 [Gemmataceae bacterium]|nr:hypothetical protein [Gemmataceae bacterium]
MIADQSRIITIPSRCRPNSTHEFRLTSLHGDATGEAELAKTNAKAKAKPKVKPPEVPLHKHPQAIRFQWVGQAVQAWHVVLTKEGKDLGWTPTKLLEAMNAIGIVRFVPTAERGELTIDAVINPTMGFPKTPKGSVIAHYEYENHEFSNGDFGIQG